jgi:hypothetical protein
MLPIARFPADAACALRGIFFDIDDTLTTEGKLTAPAYDAIWRARQAGLWVIPVTGRPAGWCDLIARTWPVDGVIGENGALAFYEVEGRLRRLFHPDAVLRSAHARFGELERAILSEVPGSRVAADQAYRMFDLAIDFREEPPDLGWDAAERIRAIFARFGAQAKVSSIHVNGWFGNYDKIAMTIEFVRARWGIDFSQQQSNFVFCGDSPNDEPMFAAFTHSCAVANISPFVDQLRQLPRYVTTQPCGAGFTELVDTLLGLRARAT